MGACTTSRQLFAKFRSGGVKIGPKSRADRCVMLTGQSRGLININVTTAWSRATDYLPTFGGNGHGEKGVPHALMEEPLYSACAGA
ncbi:hypothetical protein TNCV_1639431 [Trichonephila clavipes]|nr:hypothetical protein TNCV_1639431 [Trichonephila clavipes]